MKRIVTLALTVIFVLSLTSGAFAASIFSDVPAKHWAYDALAQLQKAGIIEGYADDTFKGDKTLSRYEMAIYVGRVVEKSDKANAQQKKLIAKLKAEFTEELAKLDMRVKAVEDKTKMLNDKVYIGGRSMVKFNTIEADKKNSNYPAYGERFIRMQLDVVGKIGNSGWITQMSTESTEPFSYSVENHPWLDGGVSLKNYTVSGPIGQGIQAKIGTDWFAVGYSTVYEERLRSAVWLNFGNKLKTQLFYGRPGDYSWGSYESWAPFDIYGGTLSVCPDNKTNAKLSYVGSLNTKDGRNFNADGNGNFDLDRPLLFVRNCWELGLDRKLSDDITLTAVYSKSNASRDNTNNLVRLQYKAANMKEVGSYDLALKYATMGEKGSIAPANGIKPNQKGIEFAVNYVPADSILMTASVFDKKYINDYVNGGANYKAGSKERVYFVGVEYSFW